MIKAVTTWILIADGSHARLVSNDGPGRGVKPLSKKVLAGANLKAQEIMADRPGRAFDSHGLGRHAMEPHSDPRDVERRRFARELAELLETANHRGRFDRLVIAAPPKALGVLRAEISDNVRAKITGELAKDLIQIPDDKLADHLGEILPL